MIESLYQQLQQTIEHLRQEFGGLHTGRANVGMVDDLQVEVYGSHMPLKGTANISCPDAQTIRIEPWDKSIIGDIERTIRDGDLGLNPQNMGEHLLIPVPPMTEERRQQMVKKVHQSAEQSRISVRNIRQDILKKVKHQKDDKELSEDEAARLEKQIQEKVDDANKTLDEVTKNKETEITTI
jgi:ribosome recycling factor